MDKQFGVTQHGFRRKLFSECLSDRLEQAKETFGVNIDTSETSYLGKLIRNTAWDEAQMWELAEDVYLSSFVRYSYGTSLDNTGEYITITRRPATKSKAIIIAKGENGHVIPKGFKVQTEKGLLFETMVDEVIVNEKAEIPIQSIEAGKHTNVREGAINTITNPNQYVESIVNITDAEGGLDIESDDEFRERYDLSHERGGGSTVKAIKAALLDMDSISDADVIENDTMQTINGIPPKSVACYVFGNEEDEDIAATILKSKAGGIEAFGETVVEIDDINIGFTRGKEQPIFVNLKLKKGNDYKGDDIIKRAVINYIGGKDDDGIFYKGLKLGESVKISRIISSVMCLGGVEDIEVEVSKDGEKYQETNIDIDKLSIAQTDCNKVVIL